MALVLILGPFTYVTYDMIEYYKARAPAGYVWPEFSDFWICLIVAALWMSLEKVVSMFFYDAFWKIARD